MQKDSWDMLCRATTVWTGIHMIGHGGLMWVFGLLLLVVGSISIYIWDRSDNA